MPSPTQYTDINITTSVAGYFANKLTESGWAVFWHSLGIFSGTAVQGEVTIVPEFPNEPGFLVLPPATRDTNIIVIPAFAVQIISEPQEDSRAGIGEDLFQQKTSITIDGYVANQAQHLAFATLFRNWFREDTYLSIYDFEANPVTPLLIDGSSTNTRITNRQVTRLENVDLPVPVRYYLNMTADIVYYD